MSKIFIGLITGPNEYGNLLELCSVSQHFDGLAVTYHGQTDDPEYKLLNASKKDGFVECIPYVGNHAHSMNHFLYNPKIEMGSWVLLRDSTERIAEFFAQNIRGFVDTMEKQGINSIYQYSKLLLFKRFSHQFFNGTPHWGFNGARPGAISIEATGWFKADEEYCYSTRAKRDKFHWVGAYFRYYLLPDSNHTLLGNCNRPHEGTEVEIFQRREVMRNAFRDEMRRRGAKLDCDAIITYWMATPLDDKMRAFVNGDKILNDAYRYFVLNDLMCQDEHEWSSLKVIS
jgi:hypothetical protein